MGAISLGQESLDMHSEIIFYLCGVLQKLSKNQETVQLGQSIARVKLFAAALRNKREVGFKWPVIFLGTPSQWRCTLGLLFLMPALTAQFVQDYRPVPDSTGQKDELVATLEAKHRDLVAQLDGMPQKMKEQITKHYEARLEETKARLEAGEFLFDEKLSAYLDAVFARVVNAVGPTLAQKKPRLLISRSPSPNASCLGDGTFVINIGLLSRLENEAQLAFVLSHEVAHFELDHVNKAIKRQVEAFGAINPKKKVAKDKNAPAESAYDRKMALLRQLVFATRRHGRASEAQADSLGLVLLKKTPFLEEQALRALAIIDTVDEDKYKAQLDLRKFFSFPEYTFQEEWTSADALMAFRQAQDKALEDSLKTHPDCATRIAVLKPAVGPARGGLFIEDSTFFARTVEIADFESVESYFQGDNLSMSLYLSLQMLEKYPKNAFLITNVGRCLTKLGTAIKKGEMSKFLEFANAYTPREYLKLLDFLHNLRSKDMAMLAYYFLRNQSDNATPTEFFFFVWHGAARDAGLAEQATTIRDKYMKMWPNGAYLSTMN